MNTKFDIDEWFKLAEEDIEAFEIERLKIINRFIESGCNKRVLNGLQFRINMERQRAKNPLDACVRISKMMSEHFYLEFCPTISHLRNEESEQKKLKSATIIPFKKISPSKK